MNFDLTSEQSDIVEGVRRVVAQFGDDYWIERDTEGGYPREFQQAMAEGGWLGITMPEAYGGAGLGVTEAALMMHTVAKSAGAMSACSAIHINLFGPHPIVVHGTDEQKEKWIPELIRGDVIVAFGVTEPDAGLDTGNIRTRAVRHDDHYLVNGQKIWTSNGQNATRLLLLARTTDRDQVERSVDGLTLFFTEFDRDHLQVTEIPKMGRKAVDSNSLFIDNLKIPHAHRVGEEGQGFRYLLHGLNPERILLAAEAVGIGQEALRRATDYANSREVFGRQIGKNQAIAHPLARNWMELEAAWLMAMKAASLYDRGEPCGAEANSAKYLAAEAGFSACDRAVLTHGGMGYAREYHVERFMREIMIPRIAPVSQEMILNYVSERVLGLPRSY